MDVALAVKPGIRVPVLVNAPTVRIDHEKGTLLIWSDLDSWSEKVEDCNTLMNFLADLIHEKGFSDDYRYLETGGGMEPLISGGWADNPFNLRLKQEIVYTPPDYVEHILSLIM